MKMARKTTKPYVQYAKEGREDKKSQLKKLSFLCLIQSQNCHVFSLLNINDMSVVQTWLYEQVVIMQQTKEQISLHYAECKQNFQIDFGLMYLMFMGPCIILIFCCIQFQLDTQFTEFISIYYK
jgi:hypothetical protein